MRALYADAMLEQAQRFLAAAQGGPPVLSATIIEPGPHAVQQGARLLVERSGDRLGSLGSSELDELVAAFAPGAFSDRFAGTLYVHEDTLRERAAPGATSIYIEVIAAKPVFIVVGAGHIGRTLAKLADLLDFHVVVIDDREEFASEERLPEADEVICDDFAAALDRYAIDEQTTIVLVTRGHKQDEESLRHCLGRGAGYLGMIGSKRRTATVLQHLRDEGCAPEDLERVRTPIGLNIGAETPEEIAVSIVAEVIMLRRGGTGRPMYHRRRAG